MKEYGPKTPKVISFEYEGKFIYSPVDKDGKKYGYFFSYNEALDDWYDFFSNL